MTQFRGRVLVAEDNPVNEEVAREFLTGFGCQIEVARNGAEAVAAFQHAAFDLIFMDIQMPELDGLAATRRIRTIEHAGSRRRTPIVALTANAFESDRQSCIAAGMDGYISKPFSEEQIGECLAAWLQPVASDQDTDILDDAVVGKLLAQRPALLKRIIDIYLAHAPAMVAKLRAACEARDAAAAKVASHNIQAGSANIGAKRVSDVASEIEMLAAAGEVHNAAPLLEALDRDLAAAQRSLRELTRSLATAAEPPARTGPGLRG